VAGVASHAESAVASLSSKEMRQLSNVSLQLTSARSAEVIAVSAYRDASAS
jgi:hypothetical protein